MTDTDNADDLALLEKCTCPSRISTWTLIKLSSCVLNKMKPFHHLMKTSEMIKRVHISSNISSTESDINIGKMLSAIDWPSYGNLISLAKKSCFFFYQTGIMSELDSNITLWEKARWELNNNAPCCFRKTLETAPPQSSSCTARQPPPDKPFKEDEQDKPGIPRDIRTHPEAISAEDSVAWTH